MKIVALFLLMLVVQTDAFSQLRYRNFGDIDWRVQDIDDYKPDSLAYKLTAFCTTDAQKVRAIFRWITENIAYRTRNNSRNIIIEEESPELDTSADLRLFHARAAKRVLKRRIAVCEGYARLFQSLCDYAGIRSEVISGYARGDASRIGRRFATNHTWNAVYLDSAWHLLDATWASGYINYSNDFVKAYNDAYFLTPPEQFIHDHYPEDPKWTLLPEPRILREFHNTPFKPGAFVKYRITSFQPVKGIIEAAVGDTVLFELSTADVKRDMRVLPSPFTDTLLHLSNPIAQTLKSPDPTPGNSKIRFAYKVESAAAEWLDLVYNNEVIMRYKLNVRKEKKEADLAAMKPAK